MAGNSCVVVILTFNSVDIIRETLTQSFKLTKDVFVVDSGSSDGTVSILEEFGCEWVNREFENYSDQRNWAIDQVADRFDWQLHLDADEVLDDLAISEIKQALMFSDQDCYLLRRKDYFMGQMLRFSGLNPWHLRLFRSNAARCEDRIYDQHFVTNASVGKLKGFMHDKNALGLADWIARHNRWSDLEAKEVLMSEGLEGKAVLKGRLFGDSRERTRYFKGLYYRLPGSFRVFLYFLYRYILKLGFMDGRRGLYFAFFQALWFRLLVDAKIFEAQSQSISNGGS